MIWYILFAHFIADYPLQPMWLIRRKKHLWGLGLHVGVHLITMLAVVGAARRVVWPFLLVLTGIHFFIDLGKNVINEVRPEWVIGPYVVDQIFHYISIVLIAAWISSAAGEVPLPLPPAWIILATGYLFVTYVWFISERILAYSEPGYQREVISQLWTRMLLRAALLSIFLIGLPMPSAGPALGLTLGAPANRLVYRRRALFTDIAVTMVVMVFVRLAV